MGITFKKGSIVAVTGGTVDKPGKFASSIQICKVIECGKSDILVCDFPKRSFSKFFKVPKAICIQIVTCKDMVLSSTTLKPKIGDLVLSFASSFKKEKDIFTGILFSITYSEGKPSKCKILCGERFLDSFYDDLMVV